MMKKIAALLLLTITVAAGAQVKQEKIVYSMKVENSPMAAMTDNMQMTVYYKNGKTLTDMTSPAYAMKTLVTDTGTVTIMTMMGQKMYFTSPVLDPGGANAKRPEIVYTTKTKEIAGYTCTKAFMVLKGSTQDTAVFWYTEKLPFVVFGKEATLYKGLKGMPLEFEMGMQQMKMSVKATKVSTEDIPDSVFMLSTDGYSKFDASMLKQMQQ